MQRNFVITLLALLLALVALPSPGSNVGFVTVSGSHFMLDSKPYYYGGTNCYYLMVNSVDSSGRKTVDEVLQDSAAMGLTVVRTWAFNDGSANWRALQKSPGVFDESVFKGLDYVLYKADLCNIRLVLPLVNYWDAYGGMKQYVAWAGHTNVEDFYTDADCRTYFKNYISAVLNRVNTYNGRVYKNDPTVFAWQLGNEPRCPGKGVSVLNAWVSEMSAYIKGLDSNHMVSTGIEGFYSNQGAGTDFITTQQATTIDYAVAHSWPDLWSWNQSTTMSQVSRQITDAHTTLNKPYVLEEFGKYEPVATRDDWYTHYLDTIYTNHGDGWHFWLLEDDARPDYDGFSVYYPGDTSTCAILIDYAARMKALIPRENYVSLGDLRALPEGTTVYSTHDFPVTYSLLGTFYIEDDKRTAGIRVDAGTTVAKGNRVRVKGTLQSLTNEKRILADSVDIVTTSGSMPRPLAMGVSAVGGRPPGGYPGPTGMQGLYNVGLLVRVWGRVTAGTGYFYLSDGSGVMVKVYGNTPAATFAAATGIAGYETNGVRTIRIRSTQDIQPF